MDYFSADFHLGHENIMHHCQRPFATVNDMDATIIGNTNEIVQPTDRLFLVGDCEVIRVIMKSDVCRQQRIAGRQTHTIQNATTAFQRVSYRKHGHAAMRQSQCATEEVCWSAYR